jgi:tRNA(fMet)-specific endonuclease VapC
VTRFCLDTSAYSYFKRGHTRITDLVDRADWIRVPAVVIGELQSGFLQGTHRTRNEAELDAFLAHPVTEMLVVDDGVARMYGEILVDLRKAGRPIPTNDIWIAATAARAGASVLTCDPHFRQIARVGSLVLAPTDAG